MKYVTLKRSIHPKLVFPFAGGTPMCVRLKVYGSTGHTLLAANSPQEKMMAHDWRLYLLVGFYGPEFRKFQNYT
jgi:hypothetical protein